MFSVRNLILVRADISRLPFVSSSVDAVHAGAALHCWPSPSAAVSISSICGIWSKFFSLAQGSPIKISLIAFSHCYLLWNNSLKSNGPQLFKRNVIYFSLFFFFCFVYKFFNFVFISICVWNLPLELSWLHFLLHLPCGLLCY